MGLNKENNKFAQALGGFLVFGLFFYLLFHPNMPTWVTTIGWILFTAALVVAVEFSYSPIRTLIHYLKTKFSSRGKTENEV